MKTKQKLISTLIMVLVFMSQDLMAQKEVNSDLLSSAQNQIIEQCLTFQPLEVKIPTEIKAQIVEYYILDHGVEFYFSPNIEINGKRTSLISKGEINSSKPYFLFHTLFIESNQALVRYYFIYTNKGVEITLPITVEFKKNNSLWQVSNYSI